MICVNGARLTWPRRASSAWSFTTPSRINLSNLLHAWLGNIARALLPGHGFYIWGGYANLGNYPPVLKEHGLYFSQAVVWDKQHPVLTRKDRMGRRVERVSFAWEQGKVVGL